jgi:hypothetical protein
MDDANDAHARMEAALAEPQPDDAFDAVKSSFLVLVIFVLFPKSNTNRRATYGDGLSSDAGARMDLEEGHRNSGGLHVRELNPRAFNEALQRVRHLPGFNAHRDDEGITIETLMADLRTLWESLCEGARARLEETVTSGGLVSHFRQAVRGERRPRRGVCWAAAVP